MPVRTSNPVQTEPHGSRLERGGLGRIVLPASFQGNVAVAVALTDAQGAVFAQWDFAPMSADKGAHLRIDLTTLDQGSVLFSGGTGNPVSRGFSLNALPDPHRQLFLHVASGGGWPAFSQLYPVDLGLVADRQALQRGWKRALTTPAQWFYVEITTFCNLECPFCPSKDLKRPRQHMTLDLAKTVFNKISEYFAQQDLREAYVQFRPMVFLHVMGEPVLHPKLTEIVALAHKAGLAVGLFTNVTLLNAKNIEKLIAAQPELVTLSVNASDEGGYSELGAKDTLADQHERVGRYLQRRVEARAFGTSVDLQYMTAPDATVNATGLLTDNSAVWRLYERWQTDVRDIHRGEVRSSRCLATIAPQDLDDPIAPGGDPTRRLALGHGIHLAIKSGCSFGNATLPDGLSVRPTKQGRCPFNSPYQQMSIFVDGSVSFCNLDYENTVNLGNLRDQGIDEIWTSARLTRIRDAMSGGVLTEPVCQKCLGQVVQ